MELSFPKKTKKRERERERERKKERIVTSGCMIFPNMKVTGEPSPCLWVPLLLSFKEPWAHDELTLLGYK